MLSKRLSHHLAKLAHQIPAIQRQFVPSELEENEDALTMTDPLLEEEHTVVRGLVHKYSNRALVLLTMNCAAYCRFCTRRRSVSDITKGTITETDLNQMVNYLLQHSEIKELIISGGDPLTVPELLQNALTKFNQLDQIKIIRIGSRLPVSEPNLINTKLIKILKTVKDKPLYLMLHFEHPSELNPATIRAVKKLSRVSQRLFSQTVFLRGVNDDPSVLEQLFSGLIEIGIKPYYLYRCDYVKGAEHFIVPLDQEIKIFTQLRSRLSGLACPMYVIDSPHGSGKVPVPLNYWQFDSNNFTDFNGQLIELKNNH